MQGQTVGLLPSQMLQMETLPLLVMAQGILSAAQMLKPQQPRIFMNVDHVFIQQQTGHWFLVINNFIGDLKWRFRGELEQR